MPATQKNAQTINGNKILTFNGPVLKCLKNLQFIAYCFKELRITEESNIDSKDALYSK